MDLQFALHLTLKEIMKVRPAGTRTEEVLKSNGAIDVTLGGASEEEVEESLRLIEDLKFFLATAPVNWQENQIIRRYYLNNDQGFVSCVFWNSLYYVTGTDIVKCCIYRMQKFGREVVQKKKFEEGIFSDLRNLKCGIDATLEQPKSDFLSFLFRNMCLKTQKKQKVFFWFSVPHDRLFADALERDLKREGMGQPSTTSAKSEPAASFKYDSLSDKPLYDQFLKHLESRRDQFESSPDQGQRANVIKPAENSNTSAALPMHISSSVIVGEDSFSSQLENTTESNISNQQQSSSPASGTNFSPQKLIVEPSNLELNESPTTKILRENVAIVDEADRGDFPLDYFPVEIEYPNQEDEFEAFTMQPAGAFIPPSMLYDGTVGVHEEENLPATATVARFPPYPMHTPFPLPMSASRSHFITNAKYYASQMQERSESPKVMNRDFSYIKYAEPEGSNEGIDAAEAGYIEQQQQAHLQFMNPYQKFYNNGIYPSYYAQTTFGNGSAEISSQGNDTMNGSYDEFFPSQDGYEQGYLLPQESWNFVPPQAMRPPTSASTFVPKSFTPNYRSTPISARNPYMPIAQGGWPQPISSPYDSKATSATSKNHPNGTFHPQQTPSFPHRRPMHGNSTSTKGYVPKHGKIAKPFHLRASSQQKHQRKTNSSLKPKSGTIDDESKSSNNENQRQQFSIPTPDSNILAAQIVNSEEGREQSDNYAGGGFQRSLEDSDNSD